MELIDYILLGGLTLAVAGIIAWLIKKKKKGETGCCGCGGCPHASSCGKKREDTEDKNV